VDVFLYSLDRGGNGWQAQTSIMAAPIGEVRLSNLGERFITDEVLGLMSLRETVCIATD